METLPELTCADISQAAGHITDIIALAIEHRSENAAVVVFDRRSTLSSALADAYQQSLPEASFIDFDQQTAEAVLAAFATLSAGDLVVLIQSTSFRLDAFRIRIELFKRQLKVIEHPHLARMTGAEARCYIAALSYDPDYFRVTGRALKKAIDKARCTVIDSGGEKLIFSSPLEAAKLNVGDYHQMTNIGGQFPIGEVFTEACDLEAVNGRVRIGFFGDTAFTVNRPPQAITLIIEKGRVVATENSTAEFDRVLAIIRADEGEVWLRELGFGLNRAFDKDHVVSDIGTFERMCGIHLSLGGKHLSYRKPQINHRTARHHVDVFVCTESVRIDEQTVYQNNSWQNT